jgi:hypothetical protein
LQNEDRPPRLYQEGSLMTVVTFSRFVMQSVMAGLLLLSVQSTQAAQTLGPVTDDIGVIKIPKGAPIQIGGYWVLSGPDTAQGIDGKRGVEVAIADIGNKLLGHPIKMIYAPPRGDKPRRRNWHPTGNC